jgi:hypothetical protein
MEYRRAALPLHVDDEALSILRGTLLELASCETAAEATDALLRLVVRLGGRVVPARLVDDQIIPLDLTLGTAPPLVTEAEPYSMARWRLEQILPLAIDTARRIVEAVEDQQRLRL